MVANYSFEVLYIVSQVLAFIAFTCDIIAMQQRKKSTLLKYDVAAALFLSLHYAFLGAWAGMISKLITTVRNGLAAYEASKNRKNKFLPIVFIVLYIALGTFVIDSWYSIIPLLVPSIYTVAIYIGNVKQVRYTAVCTNSLWLIYNICVSSIVGSISAIILIINGIIAIYRYRGKTIGKTKKKKQ